MWKLLILLSLSSDCIRKTWFLSSNFEQPEFWGYKPALVKKVLYNQLLTFCSQQQIKTYCPAGAIQYIKYIIHIAEHSRCPVYQVLHQVAEDLDTNKKKTRGKPKRVPRFAAGTSKKCYSYYLWLNQNWTAFWIRTFNSSFETSEKGEKDAILHFLFTSLTPFITWYKASTVANQVAVFAMRWWQDFY